MFEAQKAALHLALGGIREALGKAIPTLEEAAEACHNARAIANGEDSIWSLPWQSGGPNDLERAFARDSAGAILELVRGRLVNVEALVAQIVSRFPINRHVEEAAQISEVSLGDVLRVLQAIVKAEEDCEEAGGDAAMHHRPDVYEGARARREAAINVAHQLVANLNSLPRSFGSSWATAHPIECVRYGVGTVPSKNEAPHVALFFTPRATGIGRALVIGPNWTRVEAVVASLLKSAEKAFGPRPSHAPAEGQTEGEARLLGVAAVLEEERQILRERLIVAEDVILGIAGVLVEDFVPHVQDETLRAKLLTMKGELEQVQKFMAAERAAQVVARVSSAESGGAGADLAGVAS